MTPLDISRDYRYFDGVETMTFTDKRTSNDFEVPFCLRSQLSYREIQFVAGIGLEGQVLPVDVPEPECNGYVPRRGDPFIDAGGTEYLIQSATHDHLIQQFRVLATKAKA